jgi:tetratricopeptide (TPR) repeat protein
VTALGIGGRAESAPADPDGERARAHFRAGQALYELGRYDEAAREFSASYALSHRAALILNIGSCYRALGDLPAAREVFRKFLEQAPPRDPYRSQAESILREIDEALALRRPEAPRAAPERPPDAPRAAPEHTPEPPRAIPERAPEVAPTPPLAQASASPPTRRSFLRRHWWIFPVAGAVVGAAVGIYFGVRSASAPDCGSTTLGCLYPR